jgi:hypothetical protein
MITSKKPFGFLFFFMKEGLKRKLQDIYLQMDWSERLDITVAKEKLVVANIDPEKLADNDFKREQAL